MKNIGGGGVIVNQISDEGIFPEKPGRAYCGVSLPHYFLTLSFQPGNSFHSESCRQNSPQWFAPCRPAFRERRDLHPPRTARVPGRSPEKKSGLAHTRASGPWSASADRGRSHDRP